MAKIHIRGITYFKIRQKTEDIFVCIRSLQNLKLRRGLGPELGRVDLHQNNSSIEFSKKVFFELQPPELRAHLGNFFPDLPDMGLTDPYVTISLTARSELAIKLTPFASIATDTDSFVGVGFTNPQLFAINRLSHTLPLLLMPTRFSMKNHYKRGSRRDRRRSWSYLVLTAQATIHTYDDIT